MEAARDALQKTFGFADFRPGQAEIIGAVMGGDDVLAVMSAKNDPKVKRNGEYSFAMSDPVPSCLIALAVGDLRFKETGPRTGVYAEKPLLDEAAKDFAGTYRGSSRRCRASRNSAFCCSCVCDRWISSVRRVSMLARRTISARKRARPGSPLA